MLTLSERFDLRTGDCLGDDVSPEERPRVRVVQATSEVLESGPYGREPEEAHRALLPRARGPVRENHPSAMPSTEAWRSRVASIPAKLETSKVLRLADIEYYLARSGDGPSQRPLRPEDVAFQFDAEDGSDLATWFGPREGLATAMDWERARLARTVRAILSRSGFRPIDDWRPALAEIFSAEDELQFVEPILARFAGSPLYAELGTARQSIRDLEFVADLNGEEASLGGQELPVVQGLVEYGFEDSEGAWHLLTLDFSGQPPRKRDPSWGGRKLALVLAASALQRRGTTPKSLVLYHLPSGATFRADGSPARHRAILAKARDALSELARQVFP